MLPWRRARRRQKLWIVPKNALSRRASGAGSDAPAPAMRQSSTERARCTIWAAAFFV